MLLMIDNYDSFTYNLVQYFGELGEDVRVYRNDKITVEQIEDLGPARIVISPGPCTPKEAGVSVETIRHFGGRLPLLGVCLGHQSLAVAFGGEVIRADRLMHGKTSMVWCMRSRSRRARRSRASFSTGSPARRSGRRTTSRPTASPRSPKPRCP